MKTLSQYITESRNKIVLPFTVDELYSTFKDSQKDSPLVLRSFAEKHLGKYDYHVVQVFLELFNAVTSIDQSKKTVKKFYDTIQSMPVDRLNITGHGSEGFVYDIGDYIVKIYYSGKLPEDVLRLASCKNAELQVLPEIKRHGDSWIVREKYRTRTKKVMDFYDTLFGGEDYDMYDYPEDCIYSRYLDGDTYDLSGFTGKEKEVIIWLDSLDYELSEYVGAKYGADEADIILNNLGESKDGRIVLFDW